jgi:hypothetical protein
MWLHVLTDENGVARHVHDTVVVVFVRDGAGRRQAAGHDISDWGTSPLLRPYADPDGWTAAGRFHVAEDDRGGWDTILDGMDRALTEQRPGWS